MSQHEPEQHASYAPGTGSDRGVGELLLAAVTGSALAPFVQAIATKAGEDVYSKVRGLLRRRVRGAEVPPSEPITLIDPTSALVIELPSTLSAEDGSALAAVRLPDNPNGKWVLVRHDTKSSKWTAIPIDKPPADAVEVVKDDL